MPTAISRTCSALHPRRVARPLPGCPPPVLSAPLRLIRRLVAPAPPHRLAAFRQVLFLAFGVLVLGGTPGLVLVAAPAPKPASVSDVADLRKEMADQKKELDGRIKSLENKPAGGVAVDPKVVEDLVRKEMAAQKQELDGRIKSLENKPVGGAAVDPKVVEDMVRKEMAAQKLELDGTLKKLMVLDAAIDLKSLPRKIKAAKASGDIACLGVGMLVVGFTVWWILGLRHVFRRVRQHLSPNNPANVRGKVTKELDFGSSGTIASRVVALEARANGPASDAPPQQTAGAKTPPATSPVAPASPPVWPSPAPAPVVAYSAEEEARKLRDQAVGPTAAERAQRAWEKANAPSGPSSGSSGSGDWNRGDEHRATSSGQGSEGARNRGQEPEQKPPEFQPTVAQKIGLCFVEFCRVDHGVYEVEEFERELRKLLPEAKVQTGYRATASSGACFNPGHPGGSCLKGWVVTLGGDFFLVPFADSANEFSTVLDCFEVIPRETMPKTLRDCLPATLVPQGTRWDVYDLGRLCDRPNEELQRWREASQKAKSYKASPDVKVPRLPSVGTGTGPGTGATGAGSPTVNAPTTVTVGQEFVVFCRMAQMDVTKIPTVADFLEALKRRFPGVILTGDSSVVGTDKTIVWRVYVWKGEQSTNGWYLPAIKTLNNFELFGDVFVPEGNPTPETVGQVIPAETKPKSSDVNSEWNTTPGKVSVKKAEGSEASAATPDAGDDAEPSNITLTPWAEEVIKATSAAFVKACGRIAQKEFLNLETQQGLQEALVCSGLSEYKPKFGPLDINISGADPTPRLREVSKGAYGDVWLLTFTKDREELLLVTPKLIRAWVAYRPAVATLFPTVRAMDNDARSVAIGAVTAFVPCQVRFIRARKDYEVVSKGSISKN